MMLNYNFMFTLKNNHLIFRFLTYGFLIQIRYINNYSQLSMNHSEQFWEICIYMPVYRLQFDFCA